MIIQKHEVHNMKKFNIAMLLSILAIALSVMVYATSSATFDAPTAYSTSTTTSVNISATAIQTGSADVLWNITVYNKSSSDGTYSYLTSARIRNNTFLNITPSLVDGKRHWIYYRITNISDGPITSSVRIIDVDTQYYVYQVSQFGKFNITLDTGKFRTASTNNSFGQWQCGPNTAGVWSCS
jgi:uncharacterized protein YxeA